MYSELYFNQNILDFALPHYNEAVKKLGSRMYACVHLINSKMQYQWYKYFKEKESML